MRCVICADPKKRDFVARRQLEGHSANAMEGLSRASGLPIKRETISKHLKVCLAMPEGVTPKQVADVADRTKPPAYAPAEDVATLVQREVIAKLQDGTARVTVQHGLQAQQLIDRRAERAKDRELAVTLARLLHSGMPPMAMVQERTIIDVTPD
jgi:hypothetical protein